MEGDTLNPDDTDISSCTNTTNVIRSEHASEQLASVESVDVFTVQGAQKAFTS